MRVLLTRLVLVVAVLAAAPLAVAAHPGHDHKVMGTIVSIDDKFVTLKTTDGKELTFEITAATKFMRARKAGTRADLKAGLRVVANVGDGEEPLKAKQIDYGATATR